MKIRSLLEHLKSISPIQWMDVFSKFTDKQIVIVSDKKRCGLLMMEYPKLKFTTALNLDRVFHEMIVDEITFENLFDFEVNDILKMLSYPRFYTIKKSYYDKNQSEKPSNIWDEKTWV